MKFFHPSHKYNPSHEHWRWNAYKFRMKPDAIVNDLWREFNTVSEVPLACHEEFLRDVQRISSLSDTREEFLLSMRKCRSGRYGVLSDRLQAVMEDISRSQDIPRHLSNMVYEFSTSPSLDNLCEILEFVRTFPWKSPPPPSPPQLPKASPECPQEERPTSPSFDDEDGDPFRRASWSLPVDYSQPLMGPEELGSGLRDDFVPGFSDNRRVDEILFSPINQWLRKQAARQQKSAHDRGSAGGYGAQSTTHGIQQPSSTRDNNPSSSASTTKSSAPTTTPSASTTTPSASTAPSDTAQQSSRALSGKRARDKNVADERPSDAKKRKIDRTPPQPDEPPAKKRTREDEGENEGEEDNCRDGGAEGGNAAGTLQKPAESPSRKRTRDEDEADERPVDSKKKRKTMASQPPVPEPAPQQPSQSQSPPSDDHQLNHGSAPVQPSSPTSRPQASTQSLIAPVATRRQTRSAKAVAALLELDGSGRSTQQASRASRARGGNGKVPLSKVAKTPARRAAAASQSRPRRAEEKKKS